MTFNEEKKKQNLNNTPFLSAILWVSSGLFFRLDQKFLVLRNKSEVDAKICLKIRIWTKKYKVSAMLIFFSAFWWSLRFQWDLHKPWHSNLDFDWLRTFVHERKKLNLKRKKSYILRSSWAICKQKVDYLKQKKAYKNRNEEFANKPEHPHEAHKF